MLNVTHDYPLTQSAFSTQKWIMVKLTLPRVISLSLLPECTEFTLRWYVFIQTIIPVKGFNTLPWGQTAHVLYFPPSARELFFACASFFYQLDWEAHKITLNLQANQELMSFHAVEFEGYYENWIWLHFQFLLRFHSLN